MRLRELGSVRGFKVANRADQRGHCTLPFSNIVGDFPSHLEAPDYSPDRSFPKFVIRKINSGESVFPVDKSKKSMLEK